MNAASETHASRRAAIIDIAGVRMGAPTLRHLLGELLMLLSGSVLLLMAPRREFKKSAAVDKRDFTTIEFLLRKGRRQLEEYSAPGIKDIR